MPAHDARALASICLHAMLHGHAACGQQRPMAMPRRTRALRGAWRRPSQLHRHAVRVRQVACTGAAPPTPLHV